MIFLRAEGKRGKGLKEIGEKGFVRIDLASNIYVNESICFDDYQGQGSNYKKRETTKITINNGGQKFEFESFEMLIDQLRK